MSTFCDISQIAAMTASNAAAAIGCHQEQNRSVLESSSMRMLTVGLQIVPLAAKIILEATMPLFVKILAGAFTASLTYFWLNGSADVQSGISAMVKAVNVLSCAIYLGVGTFYMALPMALVCGVVNLVSLYPNLKSLASIIKPLPVIDVNEWLPS